MMHPYNHDPFYAELYLHELRVKAAKGRLARLARQAAGARPAERPRRWRGRAGALLIAAGEMLIGPGGELVSPSTSIDSCGCTP